MKFGWSPVGTGSTILLDVWRQTVPGTGGEVGTERGEGRVLVGVWLISLGRLVSLTVNNLTR